MLNLYSVGSTRTKLYNSNSEPGAWGIWTQQLYQYSKNFFLNSDLNQKWVWSKFGRIFFFPSKCESCNYTPRDTEKKLYCGKKKFIQNNFFQNDVFWSGNNIFWYITECFQESFQVLKIYYNCGTVLLLVKMGSFIHNFIIVPIWFLKEDFL